MVRKLLTCSFSSAYGLEFFYLVLARSDRLVRFSDARCSDFWIIKNVTCLLPNSYDGKTNHVGNLFNSVSDVSFETMDGSELLIFCPALSVVILQEREF